MNHDKANFNIYQSLSTEFYDLDKPIAPVKELAFYLNYGLQANGPILEPMCGSGRFLIPFIEAGLDICGFDASIAMLNVLRDRCCAKNIDPNVWQGFLQDLNQVEKYGLVFIPSGSFSLITNQSQIELSLKKIHSSLLPGGLFVFEIETALTSFGQTNTWRGLVETRNDGKFIVASFLDLPSRNNIASSICKYELVDGHTLLKTEIESMQLRLYEKEEILSLLKIAGFSEVNIINNFGHSNVKDNEVMVFECKK